MGTPERLGLIINPIAGMGGKVALKGTDGAQTLAAAQARGARPEAQEKAARALRPLLPCRERVVILTASGPMGEELCQTLGLPCQVVHTCAGDTAAQDTQDAARAIREAGARLLLFAGGDGTARDICQAIGESLPVLGIPAGVKIQSAVFALDPESAGMIAVQLLEDPYTTTARREVVDLDEDAYRAGHVRAALYGSMRVPDQPGRLQCMKQSGFSTEAGQLESIAAYLEEHMEAGLYYAVGSGSTAKCISQRLGVDCELLGVDILQDKRLLARDVTEEQLWEYARTGRLRVIVSPIGGQGFLFGRGNHQFSARVLNAVGKEHITVVSPDSKLLSIPNHTLHTDCGDPQVNESLQGWYHVLCGYGRFHSLRCL